MVKAHLPASMAATGRNIIVIGTADGGLDTLDQLVGQLPASLPASIFIVQHMAPEHSGESLLRRLSAYKAFRPVLATNGRRFAPRRIYIAPANSHLLLKRDRMLVTKGARENRQRPGIDPLFRSAAVAHGARVIGVVLSGMPDDGTAGLIAIKNCGGVTVVQDPADAAYPDMPASAIEHADVDFHVPLARMGSLLTRLVAQRPGKTKAALSSVRTEAVIAERVLSDIDQVNTLGDQVPYNCPGCGGVLWELAASDQKRYRCHTGHSYTERALLASQSEKIEEMLWISLRMFEERKNLLTSIASGARHPSTRRANLVRARETQGYIDRIQGMLLRPEADDPADTLTRVKALMAEPRLVKSAR